MTPVHKDEGTRISLPEKPIIYTGFNIVHGIIPPFISPDARSIFLSGDLENSALEGLDTVRHWQEGPVGLSYSQGRNTFRDC